MNPGSGAERRAPSAERHPPGPSGRDLLRTMLGRKRDPVALLATLQTRYGDVARVRVGDTSQFVVSGLADVKHVLVDNHRNYTKGPGYALLATILGHGLVTAEGDAWRRHRRLVQPSLQQERMRGFVAVMAAEADAVAGDLARRAQRGDIVDVFPLLMDLALRIVARTLLGSGVEGAEGTVHEAVTEVLDHIERLSTSPLRFLEVLPGGSRLRGLRLRLSTMPGPAQRRFERAVASLDALVYDVVARRRRELATGASPTDLVSLLLLARDAEHGEGEAMTDLEIRDEIMTMFLAGHETTATALAWTLYLLALHPEAQRAIAVQGAHVLGDGAAEADSLPRLEAAEHAFQEAMRLYPPVWRISRFAIGPDVIAGYDVPAGSVVVVSPYLLHRDPRHWSDPERFEPRRFAADAPARPRLAYIPFGTGPRMCLGAAFATAEAQIILTAICRAVRLEPVLQTPPSFEARVTLRPAGGIPVRLRPIAAGSEGAG